MAATNCCFLRLNMVSSFLKGTDFMKYMVIYLGCFFIFLLWLFYEQKKRQKQAKTASDNFWAKEEEANRTRKKDISHLPLIHVEESELPCIDTEDESVLYYIGQLKKIIKMPMMDLSEYTNTDLKLAYGVGNFKTLSDYDETFHNFLTDLSCLGRACSHAGLYDDAIQAYELAFHYGSAKLSDYEDLAGVYLAMDEPAKVSELIQKVEAGTHPRKFSISASLKQKLATYC